MTALICLTNISVYPKPSVRICPLTWVPANDKFNSSSNILLKASEFVSIDEGSLIGAECIRKFLKKSNKIENFKGGPYVWIEIDLEKMFGQKKAYYMDEKVIVGYILQLRTRPGPKYNKVRQSIAGAPSVKNWQRLFKNN